MIFGKNSDKLGMYVNNISTTNITARHGNNHLIIRSIGALPILDAMNRFTPTGGVQRPMVKLTVIIRPKCNGSTPNAETVGNSTGVNRIIAA